MRISLKKVTRLPSTFIFRRLHSLLGFWLVIFLFDHLFINSQMATFFFTGWGSFVTLVDEIHNMPRLSLVELMFLAIPFSMHGLWGIWYAKSAKFNSYHTNGSKPDLSQYVHNRAYTWQRITAWLLIFGVSAHVIQMRFVEYPKSVLIDNKTFYFTKVMEDKSLSALGKALDVRILNKISNIDSPGKGEVFVLSPDMGRAFFFIIRETFKKPLFVLIYSIFVVAASYHAFNGLWTFMITWGITLSRRSQQIMRLFTTSMMWIVTFLGLIAIWKTHLSTLL